MGNKEVVQKIIWVVFSRNICQGDHTFSYRLPNPLLLDGARGNGATGHHTLVVSHHFGLVHQ